MACSDPKAMVKQPSPGMNLQEYFQCPSIARLLERHLQKDAEKRLRITFQPIIVDKSLG
jgi:hypothetical protein